MTTQLSRYQKKNLQILDFLMAADWLLLTFLLSPLTVTASWLAAATQTRVTLSKKTQDFPLAALSATTLPIYPGFGPKVGK